LRQRTIDGDGIKNTYRIGRLIEHVGDLVRWDAGIASRADRESMAWAISLAVSLWVICCRAEH